MTGTRSLCIYPVTEERPVAAKVVGSFRRKRNEYLFICVLCAAAPSKDSGRDELCAEQPLVPKRLTYFQGPKCSVRMAARIQCPLVCGITHFLKERPPGETPLPQFRGGAGRLEWGHVSSIVKQRCLLWVRGEVSRVQTASGTCWGHRVRDRRFWGLCSEEILRESRQDGGRGRGALLGEGDPGSAASEVVSLLPGLSVCVPAWSWVPPGRVCTLSLWPFHTS